MKFLSTSCLDTDLVFLQEVANAAKHEVTINEKLNSKLNFNLSTTSGKRDKNSAIVLNKAVFDTCSVVDLTDAVLKALEAGETPAPVAEGDVPFLQVSAKESAETFVLGSFHKGTNGLAAVPALQTMMQVYKPVQSSSEGNKNELIRQF